MSKSESRNILDMSKNSLGAWDAAISDAERMIQETREKVKRLKACIKTFKRLRDSGEPFPTKQDKQSEASQ